LSEQSRIIGRGTWLDKVASEIIERERKLGRDTSLIRVESGLGASGIPHIGSVGDAVRSYGVKLALESAGYKSELIAYSDDFDGLRKVPAGFPDWLKEYIAHPVCMIPDPFGCHKSYADHMSSLLKDSLDKLGIVYTFRSGAESYRSGILNEQIVTILEHSEKIGKKIKEMVGQEKYESNLPYTPLCKNCGRIYTTKAKLFNKEKKTVYYVCEGTELGKDFLKGCGYSGEARVDEGYGKLVWKVEFAARWAALDIRFEAYGKELTDSVRINDWVCENILDFPPPYHVRYELFQDKSGKKLSKSTGNLVTPQEWLEYASPESLRLLMFKRIVGARNVSIDDIPVYMDEFDDLEEYYFSPSKDPNPMKDAKLRGLYEYTMLLRVPEKKRIHVPYRLLAEIASFAPEGKEVDFVAKRLEAYGITKQVDDELRKRIIWASKWIRRGIKEEKNIQLSQQVKKAVEEFANELQHCSYPEQIQSKAFEVLRANGLSPNEFFPAIYQILIGTNKGPRLGPYIYDMGVEKARERILKALEQTNK
jgi:lysyl-tRNA synthetase class 1